MTRRLKAIILIELFLLIVSPLRAQNPLGLGYPTVVVTPLVQPVDSPDSSFSGSLPVTVTFTNQTSGATICYRTDGATITVVTPGTCPAGSTTYSSGFTSPSTTFTLTAVQTEVGYLTSTQLSSTYTLVNPPVLQATYSSNASSTSITQSITGLTAGWGIVVIFTDGSSSAKNMTSSSGVGCPSSWTTVSTTGWTTTTRTSIFIGAAAGTGTCSAVATKAGGAAGLQMVSFVYSGGSVTTDGNGNCKNTNVGAGTITGAAYTTSQNGDLVVGMARVQGTDSSFVVNSPFVTTSPGQISTNKSPQGYAQAAAYDNQTSAGSIGINFVQGISANNDSCVLGVR